MFGPGSRQRAEGIKKLHFSMFQPPAQELCHVFLTAAPGVIALLTSDHTETSNVSLNLPWVSTPKVLESDSV